VRHAAFQAISILTTTGFGTADFGGWGYGAQILLFCLMFLGACAGSTAGGMKLMRIIVLVKHGLSMGLKEIHPRAILRIRFSGQVVPEDVLMRILAFFLLYVFSFFLVALVVALMGVDPETALGASIATLSNIGPGLGEVGPATTFSQLPGAAKLLLAFNMLLGRLELYTVLVVLTPMFWRRT
jgi:trk system potassium uptake protein TrkH